MKKPRRNISNSLCDVVVMLTNINAGKRQPIITLYYNISEKNGKISTYVCTYLQSIAYR